MELGNNKPKQFGVEAIKGPQTEQQRIQERKLEQAKTIAGFNTAIGPTAAFAKAFNQSHQTVDNSIINGEVKINGEILTPEEAASHGIHITDSNGSKNVRVEGNFSGNISTGGNIDFDSDAIDVPKFTSDTSPKNNNYNPNYDEVPAFGTTSYNLSNRSINIAGSVIGGNLITGNVAGDVITNINQPPKPDRETYIVSKEQIDYVNQQDKIEPKEAIKVEVPYQYEQIADPWNDVTEEKFIPVTAKEQAVSQISNMNPETIKEGNQDALEINSDEELMAYLTDVWTKKYAGSNSAETQRTADDVIDAATKKWAEKSATIPKDNWDRIDQEWEAKLGTPMNFKGYSAPQSNEIKKILSKREKIRAVLKNVGNKIKENFEKFANRHLSKEVNEDLEDDKYAGMDPETRLRSTVQDIEKRQQSTTYTSNTQYFGTKTPEMLARSERIQASKEKVDKLDIVSAEVLASKKKLDDLTISSEPTTKIETISEENKNKTEQTTNTENVESTVLDSASEIMDVKDQDKFIDDRMESLNKFNTVDELDEEIKNIESGKISIPDLIANEEDYEGTDTEVEQKLAKNKEYTDARDINMLKTAEILTALKQKKAAIEEVQNEQEVQPKYGVLYESRLFTVRNRADGSMYATLNNPDPSDVDKRTELLDVTVDETGKLKAMEPNGKTYTVVDIQNKIQQQKIDKYNNQLTQKFEPIMESLAKRIDDIE